MDKVEVAEWTIDNCSLSMQITIPNVANDCSTNGFVILSERSESKDLLPSPRSTVKSRERSFDCALRAPLRMTYGSDISASSVFRLLIRIVNCQRNKFLICGSVTGRGARRQLYLVPNVRNALAVGHADIVQILATPVFLAASATALATAGPTRLSKAAGIM